jgi:hypothetical protein
MSGRLRRRPLMVSAAIQRVLERKMDRVAIGSLADLKRAYEDELATHYDAIAAEAEHVMAISRETTQSIVGKVIRERRRCEHCGGEIADAKRNSRWFCSDRCRQRAYRERAGA